MICCGRSCGDAWISERVFGKPTSKSIPDSKDRHPLDPICFFSGFIKCIDIVEPYHPERVLRQFGRVQNIPDMQLLLEKVRRDQLQIVTRCPTTGVIVTGKGGSPT